MCCNCTEISLCLGNVAYVIQRLASCLAATAVISCIMATVLIVLAVGVGTGYHYCFVEHKLNSTSRNIGKMKCEKPSLKRDTETTTTPNPNNTRRRRRSKDQPGALHMHSDQPYNTTQSTLEVRPTMVVPLKHFALMILIKDLQERNKNFTLELIAAKF